MFYALLEGGGRGCDYTIQCGIDFKELKANTIEEARKEVTDFLRRRGCDEIEDWTPKDFEGYIKYDDGHIQSITILEVKSVETFNINEWLNSFKTKAIQKEKEKSEAAELKELERLQKKFCSKE